MNKIQKCIEYKGIYTTLSMGTKKRACYAEASKDGKDICMTVALYKQNGRDVQFEKKLELTGKDFSDQRLIASLRTFIRLNIVPVLLNEVMQNSKRGIEAVRFTAEIPYMEKIYEFMMEDDEGEYECTFRCNRGREETSSSIEACFCDGDNHHGGPSFETLDTPITDDEAVKAVCRTYAETLNRDTFRKFPRCG